MERARFRINKESRRARRQDLYQHQDGEAQYQPISNSDAILDGQGKLTDRETELLLADVSNKLKQLPTPGAGRPLHLVTENTDGWPSEKDQTAEEQSTGSNPSSSRSTVGNKTDQQSSPTPKRRGRRRDLLLNPLRQSAQYAQSWSPTARITRQVIASGGFRPANSFPPWKGTKTFHGSELDEYMHWRDDNTITYQLGTYEDSALPSAYMKKTFTSEEGYKFSVFPDFTASLDNGESKIIIEPAEYLWMPIPAAPGGFDEVPWHRRDDGDAAVASRVARKERQPRPTAACGIDTSELSEMAIVTAEEEEHDASANTDNEGYEETPEDDSPYVLQFKPHMEYSPQKYGDASHATFPQQGNLYGPVEDSDVSSSSDGGSLVCGGVEFIEDDDSNDPTASLNPSRLELGIGASNPGFVDANDSATEEYDSDNASVYAESIFSQVSMASSATTASIASLPDELISDFLSILFCTNELATINDSAIRDPKIGADRYRRNIRRLIANYGRALKEECTDREESGAARLLQSRSISNRAARDIVEQAERASTGDQDGKRPELLRVDLLATVPKTAANIMTDVSSGTHNAKYNRPATFDGTERPPVNDSAEDESDTGSELSVEDDLEEEDTERQDLQAIKDFLLGSIAYRTFKEQLVDFVHRPYEGRVLAALGADIISEDGKHLGKEEIKVTARDISWSPVRLVDFSAAIPDGYGLSDYVKGWVEDILGETWNWWPLAQRRRRLNDGFSRVIWVSPYGTARYMDIPRNAAQDFQEALLTAPAFVNAHNTGGSSQSTSGQGNSGPSGALQPSSVTGTQQHLGKPANSGQQQGATSPGTTSAPLPLIYGSQAHMSDSRHVCLCVKRGSSHKFSDMRTHTMGSDADFFRALKVNYLHLRGRFRCWFSMWQYDHCDFYQFQKFDLDTAAPQKESFPSPANDEYDFLPRPIEPSPPGGPISDQEFRDRFYKSCLHCHSWHLHHRTRLRQRQRFNLTYATRDAIALLLKRKDPLHMDDGRREQFWGIYARERRCFAWVLAYGLLFNLPGVTFFFLWLFSWGHEGDLQNAGVPVGMSISLTMLFVALLFESRERDRV